MEPLWFTFSDFIQSELDGVREHRNSHSIRKPTYGTISGQPKELFFLPKSFGYNQRDIKIIDEDNPKVLEEENFLLRAEEVFKVRDEELCNYFHYVILQEDLTHPSRNQEGAKPIQLYICYVNFVTVLAIFLDFTNWQFKGFVQVCDSRELK